MSKVVRASAVGVAVALALPLWAVPAHAETSSEPASTGAYFSSAGIDKPAAIATDPMNPTGRLDGVAPEHLAVAVRQPGTDDKKSFLAFDLDAVPVDATVNRAVVTVPLAPNDRENISMSPAAAKVMACGAGPEGFNGQDGSSFSSAPTDTCDALEVVGRASDDGKAYVFDVTPIARTWLTEANNGIVLRPADTAAPFQVVFLPSPMSTIAVDFTAPPAPPQSAPAPAAAPDTDTAPGPDGFAAGTPGTASDPGSFDAGSVGAPDSAFGVAEAPVVGAGIAPEVLAGGPAPAEAPAPQTAAAPAPDGGPPPALAPVALARPSEVLSPTTGAWLGGLALAGLLALMSLVMGDPRLPPPGTGTPSRLSRALQQRASSATAGRARLLGG